MKFFAIPLLLGILVFVAGIIGKPVYAAVFSGHVGKSGMPWNAGSWINGSSDHMQNYIDLMGHEPDSVTQGMGDVVTWPNVGGADSEAETDRDFNRTPAAWNADPPLFHGVFQDEGWFRHIWGDYPATVHRKRIIHLDWAEPIPSTLGNRWTGSTYANPTIYRDIKNGDADKYLFLLGRKFAYLDQRDGDPAFPMTMDWFYEFTLETHGKSPEGSYTDATGKHFTYQDFPYAWARWIRVFKEGYKYQRGQYPNYYFAFRPQLQFINSDRRGGGSTIRHEQLWPNNVASWSPGTRIINGITVLPPGPIGKQIDFVGASWHDSSMVRVQGESATAPGNNWNQILAGNAGFWGFNEIVAFARAQGVRMVFPEWAPRREGAAASTHPADVIRFTYAFFNANQDILDHEDYFDQGDGSIYSAWPANESGQDPIAVYKTLWRGDGHGTVGTAGTVTTGTGVGTTGGTTVGVGVGGSGTTLPFFGGCTERYSNAAGIPNNYGAAFNVFSGYRELLIRTVCDSNGNLTLSVNTPDTATQKYVSKTGFRWNGGSWVPFTFEGTAAPGSPDWLLMGAHVTIPYSDLLPQDRFSYFVAYTCTFSNSEWKCGCRDSFCGVHFWQIQAMRSAIGGTTGVVVTGGTVTGTTATGGTTAPPPGTWKMYDTIAFTGEPNLKNCGLSGGLDIVNPSELLDGNNNYNQARVDATAANIVAANLDYVSIDIEIWRDADRIGFSDADAAKYVQAINGLRTAVRARGDTRTQFGYYGAPFMTREISSRSGAAQAFINSQDFLQPSLYAADLDMGSNPELWNTMATGRINSYKALGPGKTVIPYIWPQFEIDSVPYVSQTFWDYQLQHLRPLTQGVAVWGTLTSMSDHTRKPWDKTLGWWIASKNFAASSLGISLTACAD